MRLLAFELATEACSVALWNDGEVTARHEVAPRRHAELALPWAEALLAEAGLARAQLDALAVSRGPGAFTGVRLGLSIVQGIAFALDRPVVAASTLAVLAAGAASGSPGATRVLAAIDARMGEVYAGAFAIEAGEPSALGAESVGPPGAVAIPVDGHAWIGVGTGFGACEGALGTRLAGALAALDPAALPHAEDLARLAASAVARGEARPAGAIEPAYLRDHVALTLDQQRAARAAR